MRHIDFTTHFISVENIIRLSVWALTIFNFGFYSTILLFLFCKVILKNNQKLY